MSHTLLHARIQDFFQGVGGVQAQWPENSLDILLSPQLILQFTEDIQRFYYRENYTFEGSRGGPTFSRGGRGGGVQLFPRGGGGGGGGWKGEVRMLISIETHITCDFPGGRGCGRTPYPQSGSALDSGSL